VPVLLSAETLLRQALAIHTLSLVSNANTAGELSPPPLKFNATVQSLGARASVGLPAARRPRARTLPTPELAGAAAWQDC